MDNPFADQTGDLFVLDTRDIADSKIVETVRTVEQLGKDQYQQFVTKTGCTREQHHCLIQKNKVPLFSRPPATKEKSSDKLKIASLKSNCSLFSSLYVSCQVRDGDLEGLFGHENQSFPPSYLSMGNSDRIGYVIMSREEWISASTKAICLSSATRWCSHR